MFIHNLNPTALSIFGLEIRWYGLIYALGILFAYFWFMKRVKKTNIMTKDQAETLFLWVVIGVLLGARLFIILFYNPSWYFSHPLEMLKVWKGGLSFHGGLIGAFLVTLYFNKKYKLSWLKIADILVVPLSLALAFGRVANFVNGELYGRVTNVPWSVIFKDGGDLARHPSQLYEAIKNLIIFGVLKKKEQNIKKDGEVFAWFLLLYGSLRFLVEFVREPEVYVLFLTMGQVLSLAMVIAGVGLFYKLRIASDKVV